MIKEYKKRMMYNEIAHHLVTDAQLPPKRDITCYGISLWRV